MQESAKYYLPKTLDEPFRIYILTIDELLLLVAPILMVGFIERLGERIFGRIFQKSITLAFNWCSYRTR